MKKFTLLCLSSLLFLFSCTEDDKNEQQEKGNYLNFGTDYNITNIVCENLGEVNATTFESRLVIASDVTINLDKKSIKSFSGNGFVLDMNVYSSEKLITEGTYTVNLETEIKNVKPLHFDAKFTTSYNDESTSWTKIKAGDIIIGKEGEDYKLAFKLTDENGKELNAEYKGQVPVIEMELPENYIKTDKVFTLSSAVIENNGLIGKDGMNASKFCMASEGLEVVKTEMYIDGFKGEGFAFDATFVSATKELKEGTYTIAQIFGDDIESYTDLSFEAEYLANYTKDDEEAWLSFKSGSITVSKANNQYVFDFDLVDEKDQVVKGHYGGETNVIENLGVHRADEVLIGDDSNEITSAFLATCGQYDGFYESQIILLENVVFDIENNDVEYVTGKGLFFGIRFTGSERMIKPGTYTWKDEDDTRTDFTFSSEYVLDFELSPDNEYKSTFKSTKGDDMEWVEINAGTIEVSKIEDVYILEMNLTDEKGNVITGYYRNDPSLVELDKYQNILVQTDWKVSEVSVNGEDKLEDCMKDDIVSFKNNQMSTTVNESCNGETDSAFPYYIKENFMFVNRTINGSTQEVKFTIIECTPEKFTISEEQSTPQGNITAILTMIPVNS